MRRRPALASRPADLVRGSVQVASPPEVYQRLVEVISHPRSGAGDIAQVVSDDPGLTVRLLHLVNSAFYAFPRRIETVSQAVTVVGTAQIRDLALATSVMTMFTGIPEDLADMDSFWRHSLACGVGARALATLRRETNVERMFLAGLLHDLGRLILFMHEGGRCRGLLEEARSTGELLYVLEKKDFGFDHGQVGGALLEFWNLPPSLQEAVEYHHRPRQASRFPIEAAAVHVADITVNALQLGSSGERRVHPLAPEAWEATGLAPSVVPCLIDDLEDQLEAVFHLVDSALVS